MSAPRILLSMLVALACVVSISGHRTLQGCTWIGHCLGDRCRTYDDCDGSWICVAGKCAVSGTTPPVKPGPITPTPPPTTAKRTTITSYNVMSWDNTSPGALYEYQVNQNFVNNVNIAAVHSNNWATYKYKQVAVTFNGKTATFQVWDLCSDSDCNGCCTTNKNYNGNGFLLDLDSSAVLRIWGIPNAEDTLYISGTFTLGASFNPNTMISQFG